jgi:hypothetical protein
MLKAIKWEKSHDGEDGNGCGDEDHTGDKGRVDNH